MQNFKTLRQPLMGELAMSCKEEREREEEKKMPFIVATYVYASSQGQRTHSARTNNLNKDWKQVFLEFRNKLMLLRLLKWYCLFRELVAFNSWPG